MYRSAGVLALAAVLCGCAAETLTIKSSPPGAEVFINDQLVGHTPVVWTVSREEHGIRHRVRIEDEGYQPYETEARTVVSDGRIAVAILTSAISLAFQKPTYYPPIDATLIPLGDRADHHESSQLHEAGKPVAAPGAAPAPSSDAATRLRQLEALHAEHLISDKEYEQKRRAILNDL